MTKSFGLILVLASLICTCQDIKPVKVFYRNLQIISSTSKHPEQTTTHFIIKSEEEQAEFNQAYSGTGLNLDYSNYRDSMIVGIIFGEKQSVSCRLGIDSLLYSDNQLTVYSSLTIPEKGLDFYGWPAAFIVTAAQSVKSEFAPTRPHQQRSIHQIPFADKQKITHMLQPGYDVSPTAVAIRNLQDWNQFSSDVKTAPVFEIPDINFADSMLVLVYLPMRYSSSVQFDIVGMEQLNDSILVTAHFWQPFYSTPDISAPAVLLRAKQLPGEIKLKIVHLN